MTSPTHPTQAHAHAEALRLEALRRYAVLDTEPEESFDDLTLLAATICDTPIALITLIDENRQWFLSRFGLAVKETPLNVSMCVHTIAQPGLLIVPDASKDERFARNPLVTGPPNIRFYAGTPLLNPEGFALGTLSVVDRVARTLTSAQQEALRVLGRQVMMQLELRRQTRELRESEDMFAKAFQLSPDGVTIVRLADRTILKANETISRLLGCPVEELIGKPSAEFSRWLNQEEQAAFLRTLEETGECLNFEINLKGGEGTPMRLESSSRLLTLNGEECILSVMRDVTQERRMQESLVASELRYRRLFESAKDGILILDAQSGMVVDVNPFLIELLGFSHAQFLGKAVWDLGFFKDLFANKDKFYELREMAYVRYESLPLETCDGRKIEVEFVSNVYAVDGFDVIQCNVRDITERKRAESDHKRLETCVARLNDIVIITDADPLSEPGPRILFVNEAFTLHTGYSPAEVIGRSPRLLQGPKTDASELARIGTAMRARKSVRAELINYTRAGEEIWLEMEIVPIIDAQDRLTHFVAVERNITERKRADARFRRLVDSNAQGVMFWKTDGTITGANDAFLKMVGYTREELDAGHLNWMAMTPPEYAGLDRRALEEVALGGTFTPFEKEYLRKDGSRVPLLMGGAAFEDSPSEGVAFEVDLTELKKLEQQFLRAQRMESIGTLAGGIAHDLNNVLAPIMMALELLKMKFTDAASLEFIDILSVSAQRGADLVRQVLSFARGVEGRRISVQVRHIVQEIEKIANDTFLKHIRVLTIIPSELWPIEGDPTQIHQVLLNLCVNARDAMPDGGTLTLSAENLTLDAHFLAMSGNPKALPGPYIVLQVSDTGTGMSASVVEKIFDPFFTTKEVGRGTGLGLSTSLGIITSHGGFIRVFSEPGNGTTFKIHLPAQPDGIEEREGGAAMTIPKGHDELILVVDDEAALCQIARQTLEAFGYRVLVAANGVDAVALYAVRGAEIAVVLTDMTMPTMDGESTIRVLRKMNPEVRVIATSGLANGDHGARADKLGVQHFLSKPYAAETLLQVLHEVLSAKGS